MLRTGITAVIAACSFAVAARSAAAQANRLFVQGAGLYQRFTGDLRSQTDPGFGVEGQLRYATRGWSVGVGVDYVGHQRTLTTFVGTPPAVVVSTSDANFIGVFVEPHLLLGDSRRAIQPYFLIRGGYGRATPEDDETTANDDSDAHVTSLTWNGGLGVLLRMFGPLSADVAVSAGVVKWKGNDEPANGSLTFGNGTTTTGNIMGRVGLSLALWR